MNLLAPKSATASKAGGLVSTYTILTLSGVLFGMCVTGNLPPEVKTWFVFAGTVGLLAFLGLGVTARVQHESHQRIAVMQVEERLDRHSSLNLRSEDLRLDQPKSA